MKNKILLASLIALISGHNSYAVNCPTTKVYCPTSSTTKMLGAELDLYDIAYYEPQKGIYFLKCNKVNSKVPEIGAFGYARSPITCPAGCNVLLSPGFGKKLGVNRCTTKTPSTSCWASCEPG
ncbi:MAG: hypothetical protein ACD_16C00084G0011 [uncultured bacterium]|nr:MAG: hypothetical protein ACD_16C00084G0011 [uncultured bacterium]